eukprot:scaffold54140_cov19-Tisochrysis_lutea.AAC.1
MLGHPLSFADRHGKKTKKEYAPLFLATGFLQYATLRTFYYALPSKLHSWSLPFHSDCWGAVAAVLKHICHAALLCYVWGVSIGYFHWINFISAPLPTPNSRQLSTSLCSTHPEGGTIVWVFLR